MYWQPRQLPERGTILRSIRPLGLPMCWAKVRVSSHLVHVCSCQCMWMCVWWGAWVNPFWVLSLPLSYSVVFCLRVSVQMCLRMCVCASSLAREYTCDPVQVSVGECEHLHEFKIVIEFQHRCLRLMGWVCLCPWTSLHLKKVYI